MNTIKNWAENNKYIIGVIIAFLFAMLTSCTDNIRSRKYGGTQVITIPKNEEFVNIQWNGSNLWIVTRDTATDVVYIREDSKYGIFQGKIKIIKE